MGQSASTFNTFSNNYYITGNNNGIDTGGSAIGRIDQSPSLDVSPTADINYTPSINPSWIGVMYGFTKDSTRKMLGTIANNTELIQTVKHIASAGLRIAMGDQNHIDKAYKLYEKVCTNVDVQGIITSKNQVPLEIISEMTNYQEENVNKLEKASNAHHTLSLGITGIRNGEISTKLTFDSLYAFSKRVNNDEKINMQDIIDVAGKRLGIIKKGDNVPPNTLISESIEKKMTGYGKISKLHDKGLKVLEIVNSIEFSKFHVDARLLSEAKELYVGSWDTNYIIGNILQVTTPTLASIFPSGNVFESNDLIKLKNTFKNQSTGIEVEKCGISSYGYILPQFDDTREIKMIISGQITIVNQPYVKDQVIQIGLFCKNLNKERVFIPGVFTNVSGARKTCNDVMEDHQNIKFLNFNADNFSFRTLRDELSNGYCSELDDGNVTFSYISHYQITVNLSRVTNMLWSEVIDLKYIEDSYFGTFLGVIYPEEVKFCISVETPKIMISIMKKPISLRLIGKEYFGSVLNCLGEIPDWYYTDDRHDPLYIFMELTNKLIPYLANISEIHINSGAPYNLTTEHLVDARVVSGLSKLSDVEMKDYVRYLITNLRSWMYVTGPVSDLLLEQRIRIFMRLIETVIPQTMLHFMNYANDVTLLNKKYVEDANRYVSIEDEMDKRINSLDDRNVYMIGKLVA